MAPSTLSAEVPQTVSVCSFCPVMLPFSAASMYVARVPSVVASVHGADQERYHCCELVRLVIACVSDGAPTPCVPL